VIFILIFNTIQIESVYDTATIIILFLLLLHQFLYVKTPVHLSIIELLLFWKITGLALLFGLGLVLPK